jgi:hypothetical protein
MSAVVSGFIFGLLIISGFAGFLQVVAGGVWAKWLIISGIHFCRFLVFSGFIVVRCPTLWKCGTPWLVLCHKKCANVREAEIILSTILVFASGRLQ